MDFGEIARFFDVSPITIVKYINDIRTLVDRQFIRATADGKRNRRRQSLNTQEYYINRDFYQSLLNGERFIPKDKKCKDVFDFLKTIGQIIHAKEEYQNENQIYVELNSVFKENQHIQFLKDIKMFEVDDQSLLLYLMICARIR